MTLHLIPEIPTSHISMKADLCQTTLYWISMALHAAPTSHQRAALYILALQAGPYVAYCFPNENITSAVR